MMRPRYALARSAAAELRSDLNLGPEDLPIDPEQIARHLGIEIRKLDPEDQTLSGFLLRHSEGTGRPIIGVNRRHTPARRRFTVAHELGHFLLHRWGDVRVDRHMISRRDERSSKGEYTEEIEANQFAAELLMPAAWLEEDFEESPFDVQDEGQVARLAKRYGVSHSAMTFRLANLDLIQL